MGKPLSRPGCFRKSSCCLEKHGAREGGVVGGGLGGGGGTEGVYGDGYVPQRSIYDTMCINQQIDSHHHHHHPGGSTRREGGGGEGSYNYLASGSLRVSRSPADMFDPQPRSLTPNPSFVRRLDERVIYDSLKLGGQEAEGAGCHSPGHFNRSVSPSVSSFSAPGVSSSSSKKHHHHHHHHHQQHHGDSAKSRDGRHSWKVLTPPKHLECLEISTGDMLERGGGGYLNPGLYPPPGGNSSSLTSPLLSPFSGSPLSSGYHTPVFFSPSKSRPAQTQSLRCSPPHVVQPRHYSQTQSLRLSPPQELRRSPYRAPLVQLSARDLQEDLRDRGWGRAEREREWEREREREMERGWAEREWERERERGRLERERARERERRDTSVSSFGTFGYGRAVPLCSDRDSVFLEPEQVLDTTPLLLPQPSPSPSVAPRMGTGVVGRNRAGSKVGPETTTGGGAVPKFENESGVGILAKGGGGGGPRLGNEIGAVEPKMRPGVKVDNGAGTWTKNENRSGPSIENGAANRMGSQTKTGPEGILSEGKVQSGVKTENKNSTANMERPRGGPRGGDRMEGGIAKSEHSVAAVVKVENRVGSEAKGEIEAGSGPGTKREIGAGSGATSSTRQVDLIENRSGLETEGVIKVNNEAKARVESRIEAKVDTAARIDPLVGPESGLEPGAGIETANKTKIETRVANEAQKNSKIMDKGQTSTIVGDNTETAPEKRALDVESGPTNDGSRAQKSRASGSRPNSRTRPGTATGLRPGVVSPRLGHGLGELDATAPPEGMESTWPRRIIIRKRTVRQGGALHNLPILPPLPSVLSALEKRHPHPHLLPFSAHFSENPLASSVNPTLASLAGRCSLKEPIPLELSQGAGLVGRASLKEQNLEQWRVSRELDEHRRARSKENQGEPGKEEAEREEKRGKEERREMEQKGEMDEKREEERRGKEIGDNVTEKDAIGVGVVEGAIREKVERRMDEEKIQESANRKEMKKGLEDESKGKEVEERRMKKKEGTKESPSKEDQEVAANIEGEDAEPGGGEWGEGGTVGDAREPESWDAVLEMVNTLWDDGWGRGGGGGGDTDSFSGSLQRWPLLRPPAGFGGSHPPSSAASELSLTELERRARELDSDLEHLDLSQPHQVLPEPQRERGDMYQTHPGPQREKAVLLKGVGSRSQVSLELSTLARPTPETDRPPVGTDWSTKHATGAFTVGTSSAKEDSSPDSNLTLESDSSGVFLSLSNQSQEEAGSDSDQPISGSDLGSSSTSLERDGEEAGLKEWGREESTELQWCYPSLLETSLHRDGEGDGAGDGEGEEGCGETKGEGNEERDKERDGETETDKGKRGIVSIIKVPLDLTDIEGSTTLDAPQSEEMQYRKRVSLRGSDSPLPLSPSKQPIKQLLDPNQPIRSSGLDCGDLDPFVQSDSFVYLAVSARPASRAEITTATEVSSHDTLHDCSKKHSSSSKTHLDPSYTQRDAKPTRLVPQRPEEGDFLSTDSFVYLAAPACLLLGPEGTAPYSARESDSDSSGSDPVDLSVLGCGSVAGDSDWDSDLSDKPPGTTRSKRLPAEPGWDLFGDTTEAEVLTELFTEEDNNKNNKVTAVTAAMATAPGVPMVTQPVSAPTKVATTAEQTTKKVTWQFKPAQRSVCTGSRKEREKEVTPSSSVRYTDLEGGETHRPSPSSSSSSSSSPSSSSSG